MKTLDLWFEFGSTYSYPAVARARPVADAAGIEVRWQPFLLGPLFADQGLTDSPFNLYPAKGRYMWRDMERRCEGFGLPFRRPTAFPRNGLLAARIACTGLGSDWLPDFVLAVYTANFAEDRDIASPEVLAGILGAMGLDAEAVVREAGSPANKQRLRDQTERARTLGIFGAPTFAVGDELFWGHDRLGDAVAWAALAGEPTSPLTTREGKP